MKKLRILLLIFFTYEVSAQNVNYKIIEDQPKKINNFSCNIDLAHLDAGFSNPYGISFNAGVWGHAMFQQRIGIDYTFRYGWLTFGKLASQNIKNHINMQLGGFLIFSSTEPSLDNKVVMHVSEGVKYTTATYLKVPSHIWSYTAFRGGLYLDKGGFQIENKFGPDINGNAYIFGAYGGLCFGKSKRLLLQTDAYGQKGALSHTRICLDVLITPITNAPTGLKTIPVGGRLLVQGLPALQRKLRKHKYNSFAAYEFELGYRSIAGLYTAVTLSIPISRHLNLFQANKEETITETTK
jgi:hypothetical protein